jgi:Sec-independent protein translocase protein TatA
MFGVGILEIGIIALAILVFYGPQQLPELMQQVGKFFVHVRRISNEVKDVVDIVVRDAEKTMQLPPPSPSPSPPLVTPSFSSMDSCSPPLSAPHSFEGGDDSTVQKEASCSKATDIMV